jgi:hypothetical protein
MVTSGQSIPVRVGLDEGYFIPKWFFHFLEKEMEMVISRRFNFGVRSSKARLLSLAAAMLGMMATVQSSRADTVAVTFNDTSGESLGNGPFTLGFQFTVNSTITVTALGAFDSGLDGLVESHDVGIWLTGGALQTSATVDSGTADPLINQFRYKPVSPVTLTPGTYDIGAEWEDGSDPNTFPGDIGTDFATAPQITFLNNSYAGAGTLSDPTNEDSTSPAYFGPNFTFTTVPLPSAAGGGLVLLGAMSLAAVARRRGQSRI